MYEVEEASINEIAERTVSHSGVLRNSPDKRIEMMTVSRSVRRAWHSAQKGPAVGYYRRPLSYASQVFALIDLEHGTRAGRRD